MPEVIYSGESSPAEDLKVKLSNFIASEDKISLLRQIQDEWPADVADALEQIDIIETAKIFKTLLLGDVTLCAEVLIELEPGVIYQLYEYLTIQEWAWIFTELSDDDVVSVLEIFPEQAQEKLVARLPREDKADVLELMNFPEDSAGRIMTSEFLAIDQNETVGSSIEKVRKTKDLDPTNLFFVYVTSKDCLVGMVTLRQLLLNPNKEKLANIMRTDVAAVGPNMDQEEVAELVRKHDEVSVPVVDETGKILGIITVDDVIDVIDEEQDEDIYRIIGTSDEELLAGGQTHKIVALRLPWLSAAFCGSMLVSWMMGYADRSLFQDAAAIFVFVPLICAMGGNVGVQSSTIMARFLSTAQPDWREARRAVFKEARVGLTLGIICGLAVGLFALWQSGSGMMITVMTAMICAMTSAATTGTIIPIVMKRFGFDPALATGPFVTSFNDVLATTVYFIIALAFFP